MVPGGRFVTVALPYPDLRAVASGESVVAFVAPGTAAPGDRIVLAGLGPRPAGDLAAAYRRWADRPIPGAWSAAVTEVHPVTTFDQDRLAARHVLARAPDATEALVVRVFADDGPVLGDDAFAARVRSLHAARR